MSYGATGDDAGDDFFKPDDDVVEEGEAKPLAPPTSTSAPPAQVHDMVAPTVARPPARPPARRATVPPRPHHARCVCSLPLFLYTCPSPLPPVRAFSTRQPTLTPHNLTNLTPHLLTCRRTHGCTTSMTIRLDHDHDHDHGNTLGCGC